MKTLYQTLFITAYYGLFRLGEVSFNPHVIKAKDVHIALNKNKLLFLLRSSKTHCKSDLPQTVKITSSIPRGKDFGKPANHIFCPFKMLKDFLLLRGKYRDDEEPFFVFSDRSPVTPIAVAKVLKAALRKGGFDASKYSFHSIRSGRCVDLLHHRVSIETIKKLGRWKSNAVYKYLSHS